MVLEVPIETPLISVFTFDPGSFLLELGLQPIAWGFVPGNNCRFCQLRKFWEPCSCPDRRGRLFRVRNAALPSQIRGLLGLVAASLVLPPSTSALL
jgi:hypothetical protein